MSIWNGAMPLIGESVFDGVLNLVDHQVCVADLENLTRWVTKLVGSGPQRVVVCADDPGYASRVHVGFGLGGQARALTTVTGHPLPPVLTAPGVDVSRPDELGLILDGHDSPLARLAAAVKLLAVPLPGKPWPYRYEISLVVEWLRGLASSATFAQADALGEVIVDQMKARYGSSGAATAEMAPEDVPLAIATNVLRQLATQCPTGQ
ncbi:MULTISPECIES: hypothetical protein [unclassified Micromonospora]|uniref:hypothetical protein n=1 Tax=unclassified Micromonospora TaxID=2617518 RepID=UPI0033302B80